MRGQGGPGSSEQVSSSSSSSGGGSGSSSTSDDSPYTGVAAADAVTTGSAGAGNPTAAASVPPMVQLPGYLPWSMPTHNVMGSAAHYSYFKHDNDSVPHRYPSMPAADQMCEEFWGSGFDYLHNLLGNPPPGPFDSRSTAGNGASGGGNRATRTTTTTTTSSGNSNSSTGNVRGRRLWSKSVEGAATGDRGLGTGGNGESWGPDGWFRCFHSRALHSSICEGSMVAVYPSRMKMAQGE